MKQVVRNIVAIVALCMISAMAWADGDVKFVYQFNGQEALASSPGSITSEKSGTICTLTVTPQERNYLISISAVRTIAGTNGQIRTRTPEVDESVITVTPADANADKSGVTTWTLTMPESPYDVQVTANFGSRTSIDGTVLTLSATSFTYDGTAKEPTVTKISDQNGTELKLTAGTDYTIAYSNNTNVPGADDPQPTVTVTGINGYTGTVYAEFTISKATITVTAPTAIDNLTYTGKAQALVNVGTASAGTLQYKLGANGAYGTTIPTGTDAGTYEVFYQVVGDANHSDVAEAGPLAATIAKAGITPTVSITGWTYGATANTPTVSGNTGKGSVAFTYATKGTETFGETVPTDAGEYTVKATIAETTNYNGAEATADFIISPAQITGITLKQTALIYNGKDQTVEISSVTAGTLTISENDLTGQTGFSSLFDISGDTQKEKGSYTVTLTAKANSNFSGSATADFTISYNSITEDALGIPAGQVYGTYFSSKVNYELPEKVMAYIITGVNGTNTVLEEINYIPIGVPVLLEKKETVVETRTATNPDTKDNWLHHADKETTISRSTGTAYYLYNGMFIRATENKAAANNNYLIVPASAQAPVRALNIGHGDGTTGIESLGSTESSNDERWYDLQGRRIERPAKTGLYILNGKKVVIR